MAKYLNCRLCRGYGFIAARHPLDDPMKCPDCDGLGQVERGSEIQAGSARQKHPPHAMARDAISAIQPDIARIVAERDRLREALREIARQKLTAEFETEYDVEVGDFEAAYDECVRIARAALEPKS